MGTMHRHHPTSRCHLRLEKVAVTFPAYGSVTTHTLRECWQAPVQPTNRYLDAGRLLRITFFVWENVALHREPHRIPPGELTISPRPRLTARMVFEGMAVGGGLGSGVEGGSTGG